ncbi:hypothetical protein CSPAE12_03134 [Colletotrichum incanum]|nr:hypothetical protein CSPAE12_03134 [Colletotrichum incanum]
MFHAERPIVSYSPSPGVASGPPVTFIEPGDDGYYFASDADSNIISLASTVRDFNFENDRRYHKFKEGRYVFPNDDAEQEREDMKHTMVVTLCGGALHSAPLENPREF